MWHFDAASWYYATVYRASHQPRAILPRAEVAQLAEHSPEKAGVDSSILSLGTKIHNRRSSPVDLHSRWSLVSKSLHQKATDDLRLLRFRSGKGHDALKRRPILADVLEKARKAKSGPKGLPRPA